VAQRRCPSTDVARRVGHGIPVLLRVYANCIDGQADAGNPRIDDACPATILVASNYRLPPGIA
jgi:hypothetical protein